MEYKFADWKAYQAFIDAHKKDLKEGDRITIEKPIMPGAFPVTAFEVVPPLPEYPKRKPTEWEDEDGNHWVRVPTSVLPEGFMGFLRESEEKK